MSQLRQCILGVCSFVLIGLLFLLTSCGTVNVRDMSEVASRGSFVFCMLGNEDKIADSDQTLYFGTYDEFCKNRISETVIFSRYENVDGKYTKVDYQAKNERYNSDYFDGNHLIVAFFETKSDVNKMIVSGVEITDRNCKISLVATLLGNDLSDEAIPYACFIETQTDVTGEIQAEISIEDTAFHNSVTVNFSDEKTAADLDCVTAYSIASYEAFAEFAADHPLVSDSSSLWATMTLKFTEEYFSDNALLWLDTPGKFYGFYAADGDCVQGIRLDSDHYEQTLFEDTVLPRTQKAVAVLLSVPKEFDRETLRFSFRSYSEWEEGVTASNVQSGEITLVRTENGGKQYVTLIQQGQ